MRYFVLRMRSILGAALCVALLLLVCACAKRPVSRVCGGDVFNTSGAALSDLRIVHEPTGRFVAVGTLHPGRSFLIDVAASELAADAAVLTWTDASGGRRREVLDLRPLKEQQAGRMFRVEYIIGSGGRAGVRTLPCGGSFPSIH